MTAASIWMAPCREPQCDNPGRTRGLCNKHYMRLHRSGGVQPYPPRSVRFWAKVQRGAESDCWPWLGGRTGTGYGMTYEDGRRHTLAHRYAYEQIVGPIPPGLQLDHLCRNRICVNPGHLEPVTPRENTRRSDQAVGRRSALTHCMRGHAFDDVNTIVDKRGRRSCKACQAARRALA